MASNNDGLTKKTSQVLVLRASGAALALVSGVLVGRIFGATWTGTYYLALAIVSVGATLSRLGMDLPTMKLVTIADRKSDWESARGLLRKASAISFVAAGLLTAILMGGAPLAGLAFSDDSLPPMLRLASVSIIPLALLKLQARALMAVGRPLLAEFLQRAGFQIAFIALILTLSGWLGGFTLGIGFSLAYWLLFTAGRIQWARVVPSALSTTRISTGVLLRPAMPLLLASSVGLVIGWTDTLMIGYLMTPKDVGIYGAAIRTSGALTFVLAAAGSIFGPQFAAIHAKGDMAGLSRLTRRVARTTALLALPLFAVFVLAPRPVMELFGPEFTQGSTALMILSFGQYVNAATGLVGILLAMSGRERRLFQATTAAAACNVVLNVLLIPRIGIEGAAIASAISLILTNTLYVVFVRRDLGISVITDPIKRLRSRVRNRGTRRP